MFGSFTGFWIKLRRPALLLGTYGALAAVAALITTVTFVYATATPSATTTNGPGGGPPGAGTTTAELAQSSGLLAGLTGAISLLGIVAVCIAASQLAGEYSQGTLRNLLIRRPQRLQLLGGAWAAVVTFMVGAVVVAAAAAAVTALVVAPMEGISTAAWFTPSGWSASWSALGESALAITGYTLLGAVLGLVMRAPVAAVAVGVGWLLALENVLAGVISGSGRWMPGRLLSAIAAGGSSDAGLSTALATSGAYLAIALASAAVLFSRRDVTT